MSALIIVIPEITKKPKFDLVDPETAEERELTLEEQSELDNHTEVAGNYLDISDTLDTTWPFNNDWETIIGNQATIYTKSNKNYQVYRLHGDRFDLGDLPNFVSREKVEFDGKNYESEMGCVIKWTIDEWLENNQYVKVVEDFNGK